MSSSGASSHRGILDHPRDAFRSHRRDGAWTTSAGRGTWDRGLWC
ncbi:hypothetical protein [Arthrobacter livingstonensis]|nr:hypothetical protein [Arthrobacter livingstonensis]